MMSRFVFPLIAVFWVVMNVLLWRSEFGGRGEIGGAVPVEVVWNKILTAPDDSSLEISQRGTKIGYCRWRANVGEEIATGKVGSEEFQPEGRVKKLTGYTIDFDGNLVLGSQMGRVRFELHASFGTNHLWQGFTARMTGKAADIDLSGSAADEKLSLSVHSDGSRWEREFSFSEARDPQVLMKEFGLAPLLGVLAPVGVSPQTSQQLSLGLQWQASGDWLKIGRSRLRVYRLEAKLLDKYKAVVIVSRVGEILKVELPNDIRLVNEALSNI